MLTNSPLRTMLLLAAVLFGSSVPVPTRAETIRLGGTGGAIGGMRQVAEEFARGLPDTKVILFPSLGSGGGIKALLSGALDVAFSSRSLTEPERNGGAVAIEYARTPVVFATSVKNRLSDFTLEQIIGVYAGKIRTWPDGTPVRLVLRPATESDTQLLRNMSPEMDRAIQEALSRKGMIVAATDQESAEAIETIAGALGTATLAQILSEKRSLKALSLNGIPPTPKTLTEGLYPYGKTFSLVTRQNPSPQVQRFVQFVFSPRGRRILTASGHGVPER